MTTAIKDLWYINRDGDMLKPAGFRQHVYSLLLCTFAINLLSLALPIMTLQVYDRILPNPGTGTLPVLISGVCVAICLEALLRLSRAYVIGRSGAAYEHRMACLSMERVLGADLSKMGKYGIGEHLHRMGSVGKLRDFYNGYALSVLFELAFVPLFFILILYIAQPLAIIPAVILTAFVFVSLIRGKHLRKALKDRELADDERFNFLIESLEGVHTIKAFALEKFFERRYEALEEDSTFRNYRVTEETSATFNSGAIFSHLMVASVISFGAWCVLSGFVTTGGLIACLLLSGRMMQPVQKALGLWARYQDFTIAREHVEEVLSMQQHQIIQRSSEQDIVPNGHLVLQNMSYQSPHDEIEILKDISLEVKRGETVLISGEHGAGKSILLSLIAGIYPQTSGVVLIDGQPVNTFQPEELVRHVAYIGSQPLIFRGTIRDNITSFGQTPEAKAQEVTGLLQVDKEIAKLPSGLDTFLQGNNTDVISPGLKQRIAIIRALASKPRLILFDNADRTLDKEGYTMIYSFLARLRGKASLILVSEDQNIMGLADRHYELKERTLQQSSQKAGSVNVRPYKELRL